jgi:hypothetical protein
MSGACERIQAIISDAEVKKAGIQAIQDNNVFALFNKLADKIGGKNESTQMTVSVQQSLMKSIQDTQIKNNCSNVTNIEQTNSIVQSPACIEAIGSVCRNTKTGEPNLQCVKEMNKTVLIKGVKQGNAAKSKSSCQINSAIQALTKQESSIENVARMKAMQEAQGMGASNKGQQVGCSDIKSEVSDEKYLKAVSECVNQVKATQLNLLNTCNADGVDQANDVDLMNDCLIGAGIVSETSQSASNKNTSEIASEQLAVGITPFMSSASLGSCCICCIIIIIIIAVVGVGGGAVSGMGSSDNSGFSKFKSFKKF